MISLFNAILVFLVIVTIYVWRLFLSGMSIEDRNNVYIKRRLDVWFYVGVGTVAMIMLSGNLISIDAARPYILGLGVLFYLAFHIIIYLNKVIKKICNL